MSSCILEATNLLVEVEGIGVDLKQPRESILIDLIKRILDLPGDNDAILNCLLYEVGNEKN